TCTVKLYTPASVGVPVSAPVAGLIARPGGNCAGTVATQLLYAGVRPVAAKVIVGYSVPTVPEASGETVVISSGAGLTVSWNAFVVVTARLSCTCTVKLYTPASVGVPVNAPVAGLIASPGGNCAGTVATQLLYA